MVCNVQEASTPARCIPKSRPRPRQGVYILFYFILCYDPWSTQAKHTELLQKRKTDRQLCRLLADGSKEVKAGGGGSPNGRSGSSQESALSLLSILSTSSSMAEVLR